MSHVPNYPKHTPEALIALWLHDTEVYEDMVSDYLGFDYWSDDEYNEFHSQFYDFEQTIERIEADLFALGYHLIGRTWTLDEK